MKRVTDRNIVRSSRRGSFRFFRAPEAAIEGVDFSSVPGERSRPLEIPVSEKSEKINQIGVPKNLAVDEERIIKKGPSTFIDVFVSFEPADGADYHEFRVAKIPVEEELPDGES